MRYSDYIASIWLKVRHSHPSELAGSKIIKIVDEAEKLESVSIGVRQGFELGFQTCMDRIHDLQQRVKQEEATNE